MTHRSEDFPNSSKGWKWKGEWRGNGKTLSKLKTHFIKAKNTLCKYWILIKIKISMTCKMGMGMRKLLFGEGGSLSILPAGYLL